MIAISGPYAGLDTSYKPGYRGRWEATGGMWSKPRNPIEVRKDYWYWFNSIGLKPQPRRLGDQLAGTARCDKEKDYG